MTRAMQDESMTLESDHQRQHRQHHEDGDFLYREIVRLETQSKGIILVAAALTIAVIALAILK